MSTGKGRIRASTKNRESGRVPEMWDRGEYWEDRNPGGYREGNIRVSTEKGRIWASTRKGRIRESTGKVKIG